MTQARPGVGVGRKTLSLPLNGFLYPWRSSLEAV